MRCMFTLPEDDQMVCIRTATIRFSHPVRLTHPLQHGDVATTYAYVCDVHEEAGAEIAARLSEVWKAPPAPGPDKVRLDQSDKEI